MSLITRCPACETLFKVVPDQLRISDGWVRCGQCEEVFDASRNLLSEAFPSTVVMDTPPMAPVQDPVSAEIADFLDGLEVTEESAVPDASFSPDDVASESIPDELVPTQILDEPHPPNDVTDVDLTVEFDSGTGDAEIVQESEISDSADEDDDDLSWGRESESPAPDLSDELEVEGAGVDGLREAGEVPLAKELEEIVARRSQHAPLGEFAEQPDKVPDPKRGPFAMDDEPDAEPESVEPSFMQGLGSRSVWRKPFVRLGLSVMALMLLGMLSVQVTIQERDRIAALAPAVRPWVSAVCNVANCAVSPLRQIESIVIESSSFAKTRGDVYRFDFVIRNTAGMTLATPAVELSLTDPQNRPVIRRVFLPAEFGAHPDALAPGSEWSGSLAIGVKLSADVERISGYRVLAFYP
ncbi:MAG: DUF3426 domain-containing protein [Rhodoferax sp.]|jgi:predicted Zn finger-like uncharacterized protein|nr:DUF3426 domain-containing protein [Rhodoferax sp.]MBK7547210.1 DUF3426 domain-containing protein [Rhodoferax sp.]